MNRKLMEVIVNFATFLELSSDDVIDPDAAVGQLEELVFHLRELDDGARAELTAYVLERARGATDAAEREFLEQFESDLSERAAQ